MSVNELDTQLKKKKGAQHEPLRNTIIFVTCTSILANRCSRSADYPSLEGLRKRGVSEASVSPDRCTVAHTRLFPHQLLSRANRVFRSEKNKPFLFTM
ncbi:hypothetical protein J6590_010260 [Homalodisca vitripennis]|nr:hypothetical protein J6590_010260 [Homalodisca vitripennis]